MNGYFPTRIRAGIIIEISESHSEISMISLIILVIVFLSYDALLISIIYLTTTYYEELMSFHILFIIENSEHKSGFSMILCYNQS